MKVDPVFTMFTTANYWPDIKQIVKARAALHVTQPIVDDLEVGMLPDRAPIWQGYKRMAPGIIFVKI
jgi:hypothetical protein